MSGKKRIFIVEDEQRIADVLTGYLQQAGFETIHFETGSEIAHQVREQSPDLVLLDIMLPGKDGTEVCREIRGFSQIPIIMLTARVEEIDRLLGLELGADDYICKPFSPREVVARVKAVLRRSAVVVETSNSLSYGPLKLDRDSYTVSVNRKTVDVTPKEFKLLQVFMQTPGRVYSRDQLIDHAYPHDDNVSDRTIDTHIKNLRKKLSRELLHHDVIQSIYGVGYKFMPPGD